MDNPTITPMVAPFKKFCMSIGALPSSYKDSLDYYETLLWLIKYLENTIIPVVNNNGEAVTELQNLYIELKNYVEHYFDNLDVQEEINNKLDEMIINGQFELYFAKYVDTYVESTNNKLNEINEKVESIVDIAPKIVSSIDSMTDHNQVYVLTTNNNWYYYNGTNFVSGGVYNSDVTDEEIKWYLDSISSNSLSLYNPYNAVVGGLSSANGTLDTTNTNFWVTDYIPCTINDALLDNNYYRVLATSINDEQLNIYKICVYDENKTFIKTYSNIFSYFRFNASDLEQYEDMAYIRVQFSVSNVPFVDRYKVLFSFGVDTQEFNINNRYNMISNYGIANNSIENSKLTNNLYINNFYNMLENGIMPFTKSDISYGSIMTATGETNYQPERLHTCKLTKIPKGTSFTFTNDWKALAFVYTENGTYQGRYVSSWSDAIYVTSDVYLKFAFINNTLVNINNQTSVTNLLSNIKISKYTGLYEYTGEKVVLKNKYSSYNTGITLMGQDSACYNNYIVSFNSTGYYKVMSAEGDLLKSQTALDQVSTYAPHSNCVCFGTEKYDNNDIFPLLYTNGYNNTQLPVGSLYCYRLLDNMNTSLQQQILIDFTNDPIWAGDGNSVRPYGNFLIDTDNNYLYAYVMIDSLNVTRFFKFNLPLLNDGSIVRLAKTDIIEYFDTPYEYFLQGGTYYNGKIYSSCGFSANDCKLYVIDLIKKECVSIVPLGSFVTEPETVFVYNDYLYVSSSNKLSRMDF